jgi:integrase
MKGSVFKRCGCTETVDGRRKQLGAKCPKLRRADGTWNPRHGAWYFKLASKPVGSFSSQAEAQRALEAARDRVRRGVSIDDVRVDRFLTEWLDSRLDIRPSTRRGYRIHIHTHWLPGLGQLNLCELRAAHVAEVLAEVPGSDANRQRVRATLRSALSDAVRQGLVLVNAAALVKLPSGTRPNALVWTDDRVSRWRLAMAELEMAHADGESSAERLAALEAAATPPSPVMVWTPAQLGTFLDHAVGDRLYALDHLVAHRGLRRGEACGVRWQDIDLRPARSPWPFSWYRSAGRCMRARRSRAPGNGSSPSTAAP